MSCSQNSVYGHHAGLCQAATRLYRRNSDHGSFGTLLLEWTPCLAVVAIYFVSVLINPALAPYVGLC